MTSDEEKIAALKAIRDKARASHHEDSDIDLKSQLENKRDSYKRYGDYDDEELKHNDYLGKDRFEEDDYDESFFDKEDDFDEDSYEDDFEEEEEDDEDEDLPPADTSGVNEAPWRPAAMFVEYEEEPLLDIQFNGKNLENGEFNNENLENANFSVANLTGVNFSGSKLKGADFSGANLTNTDLTGADLTGAIFAGAQLIGTNFTGANLKHAVFTDVYFDQAILTDIVIDEITMEELQKLIEYLAKYYPHMLDLTKINLTMLDLRKIDLTKVNLRGVDFTGVDFTGINIMELDLSETNITPEQIAQALGRIPTPQEIKQLMAPKKAKPKGIKTIDFSDLFVSDARNYGVYDYAGMDGMNVDKLVNFAKRFARKKEEKAPVQDKDALEMIRQQNSANKEELRNVIEERKKRVLANKSRQHDVSINNRGSNQR